jgi:DNA-binding response OmpR family regulator
MSGPGASAADSARVLVVDDDRDAADSLAMLLARRGFEARCAYGAAEALDVARAFRPRQVLLDLRLGDADGAELAQQLRGLGRPLRVIALTGSSRAELGEAADLFDGFVRKPVELADLVAILRQR